MVSPDIRKEILAEHARNPQRFSPFRTATALGVPINDVIEVVDSEKAISTSRQMRFDGNGKPELEAYVVGRRRGMSSGWNNKDPQIALARRRFEEGTHMMVTGYDGPWVLLYSIPRKGPAKPLPSYFSLVRS